MEGVVLGQHFTRLVYEDVALLRARLYFEMPTRGQCITLVITLVIPYSLIHRHISYIDYTAAIVGGLPNPTSLVAITQLANHFRRLLHITYGIWTHNKIQVYSSVIHVEQRWAS